MWTMFARSGFGAVPKSGFPGEGAGKLRAYASWKPIEQATMAFGHGISVSLLQLARAYTIFANDGELLPVTLIKRSEPVAGVPAISPHTAQAIRKMLELCVQPGGTAPTAQVPGYRVAGKTGTAHKAENGRYSPSKYISSVVGIAPVSDPRIIVAVMIDEPNAGQHYGGTVAAPVFREVVQAALRTLSVPHDAPTLNVKLPPADAPLIREDVWIARDDAKPKG
jgi:cell division protein FtsI (penicillin-binding protein 3)